MTRRARPPFGTDDPQREHDAPADFDWPPAADALEACEIVSLEGEPPLPAALPHRDDGPCTPRPAAPPHTHPRPVAPPRPGRAASGEELVWPPPVEELEALEIEGTRESETPTAIVPPPPPRPRGPRIEAVLGRPRRASERAPALRPPVPRLTPIAPSRPPTSTFARRPPVAFQASVIGVAMATVGAVGIWLVGRASPGPGGSVETRPAVAVSPVFRPPVRRVASSIDEAIAASEAATAAVPGAAPAGRDRPPAAPVDAPDAPPEPDVNPEPPQPGSARTPPDGASQYPPAGLDSALLPGQRVSLPAPPPAPAPRRA